MARKPLSSSRFRRRPGVVLMVVLGMLALFMLICVSYVLTANFHKRGAALATRAEQHGIDPVGLLHGTALQVVRGSNDPQSVIGPHGLLEDMYGERDSIVGCIPVPAPTPTNVFAVATFAATNNADNGYNPSSAVMTSQLFELTSAVSFGPDRQPGVAGADDDNNKIVDDISEASNLSSLKGWDTPLEYWQTAQLKQAGSSFYPAQVEGYFAGCVLTMLDGPLANQSTRIVRWYAPSGWGNQPGRLVIEPFDVDLPPLMQLLNIPNHRFLINGRPFNGAGFGYAPGPQGSVGTMLNFLDPYYQSQSQNYPIALLPNPVSQSYRSYLMDRPIRDGATPPNQYSGVDADEDYDAPDFQNMILAGRTYNPFTQRWDITSPSLHRPDLVVYWMNALGLSPYTAGNYASGSALMSSTSNLSLRRRFILRPDGYDNYDPSDPTTPGGSYSAPGAWVDLNGNGIPDGNDAGGMTPGSPSFTFANVFDPVSYPFDVDNDNDGMLDSIWVDVGYPVQSWHDGRLVKPLAAILCLDLDSRINVNVHGSPAHYRYGVANSNTVSYNPGSPVPGSVRADEVTVAGGVMYYGSYAAPYTGGSLKVPDGQMAMFSEHLDPRGPVTQPYARFRSTYSAGTINIAAYSPYINSNLNSSLGNARSAAPAFVAQGLGFSVADISLAPLFPPPTPDLANVGYRINLYRWLLEGRFEHQFPPTESGNYTSSSFNDRPMASQRPPVPGRYGETYLLHTSSPGYPTAGVRSMPRAGVTASTFPTSSAFGVLPFGVFPGDDNQPMAPMGQIANVNLGNNGIVGVGVTPVPATQALVQNPNFRGNYLSETSGVPPQSLSQNVLTTGGSTASQQIGHYASPIDPNGRLIVGLDLYGRPVYSSPPIQPQTLPSPGSSFNPGDIYDEAIDDPWEFDPSRSSNLSSLVAGSVTGGAATPPYGSQGDVAFGAGELQALLRPTDPDTQNEQGRLRKVWTSRNDSTLAISEAPFAKQRFTTDSWDLPVPNLDPPAEIREALNSLGIPATNLTFGHWVLGKLGAVWAYRGGHGLSPSDISTLKPIVDAMIDPSKTAMTSVYTPANSVTAASQTSLNVAGTSTPQPGQSRMFSPDLLLGLRMDINRTIGNGLDDNQNGVVDEPAETWKTTLTGGPLWAEKLWEGDINKVLKLPPVVTTTSGAVTSYAGTGTQLDANWDGRIYRLADSLAKNPLSEHYGRQELAKHLYCLMMLVMDTSYLDQGTMLPPDPTNTNSPYFVRAEDSNAYLQTTLGFNQIQQRNVLTAYRVAQWAVNAVDFRDRDAVMTGFEFDIYPFSRGDGVLNGFAPGGWDVDDRLYTNDNIMASGAGSKPLFRGIVWGMEYPELQITETMAFHDLRIADTNLPVSGNRALEPLHDPTTISGNIPPRVAETTNFTAARGGSDADFDQVRLPEGTAIVELYATGNAPAVPGESQQTIAQKMSMLPNDLYTYTTSAGANPNAAPPGGALNLSLTASASVLATGTLPIATATISPVWRLAITTPHQGVDTQGNKITRDPTVREMLFDGQVTRNSGGVNLYFPDSSTLRPEFMNVFESAVATTSRTLNYQIRRAVYFVPGTGATYKKPNIGNGIEYYSYYGGGAPVFVQPGQYAVVGPARGHTSPNHVTQIGWSGRGVANAGSPATWTPQLLNLSAPTSLVQQAATVSASVGPNYPTVGTQIKPPVPIPVGAAAPDQFIVTGGSHYQGFNISEPPTGYYPIAQNLYNASTVPGLAFVNGTFSAANTPTGYIVPPITSVTTLTISYLTAGMTAYDAFPISLGTGGSGVAPTMTGVFDDPFDMQSGSELRTINAAGGSTGALQPGTYTDICTVFLQRLADPTKPWNPEPDDPVNGGAWDATLDVNPYLTIDWMPIDLTVFNGQAVYPMIATYASNTPTSVSATFTSPLPYTMSGMMGAAQWPTWTNSTAVAGNPGRNFLYDRNYSLSLMSRQRGPRQYQPNSAYSWPIAPSTASSSMMATASLYNLPSVTGSGSWPSIPYSGGSFVGGLSEAPIWSAISDNPRPVAQAFPPPATVTPPAGSTYSQYFGHYAALHTFGYINDTYGYPMSGVAATTSTAPTASATWFAASAMPTGNLAGGGNNQSDMIGAPQRPFPWLTWNNRPYASGMELMLVPASSPGRFGVEFSYITNNHYGWTVNGANSLAQISSRYFPQLWSGNDYQKMRGRSWGTWSPYPATADPSAYTAASSSYMYSPALLPHVAWSSGNGSTPSYLSQPGTYGMSAKPTVSTSFDMLAPSSPFGHLLNFFASSPMTSGVSPIAAAAYPNYGRIFEFVHVPSRFNGTRKALTDNAFGLSNSSDTGSMNTGTTPFVAPHNYISKFREPGKINLNTLVDVTATYSYASGAVDGTMVDTSMAVAITNGHPAAAGSIMPSANPTTQTPGAGLDSWWADFNANRYVPNVVNSTSGLIRAWPLSNSSGLGTGLQYNPQVFCAFGTLTNPNVPSAFRLYRSFAGSMPSPVPNMFLADGMTPAKPYIAADNNVLRRLAPEMSTPLNPNTGNSNFIPDPYSGGAGQIPVSQPLFAYDGGPLAAASGTGILTDGPSTLGNAFRDGNRNPYFRYQLLTKTGNHFTTRSNVYALWVTIGYFEVARYSSPPSTDESFPNRDGYRLVRELGAETGMVERHRAFYIIDRSIPVAFQRGENFNVENTFLVKRIIQ